MKRTLILAVLALAVNARAAVLQINVNDMIHPISDEFIGRALAEAQRTHSEALLIVLQTPGGLIESTRSIVEKIMTSRVPVVVYVAPAGSRAASAGFFIVEAADVAAMAPGTNTGAAHPVILGKEMDPIMKTKLENDAAAFMRTVAAKRGRNVAVAESAVRESKSFTEHEALQQKLIDVIAPDVPSLLRAIEGRTLHRYDNTTSVLHIVGKPVNRYEMTLKERLLSTLMDPNIAFLLFALGGLAIFAELNHARAAQPRRDRTGGDDRRDRRGPHGARAGRQGLRARRDLERGGEEGDRRGGARARGGRRRPALARRARGVESAPEVHRHGSRRHRHHRFRSLPAELDQDPPRVRARRHLSAGASAPRGEGAGHLPRLRAGRPDAADLAAAGGLRGAAAGHHHARQRHAEGQRGRLPPRHRAA